MATRDGNRNGFRSTGFSTVVTDTTYNLATGKLVVVSLQWFGVNTRTVTVTDTAGNTYTPGTKYTFAGTDGVVQLFYCLSTTTANASNIWTGTIDGGSIEFSAIDAQIFSISGTASLQAESAGATGSSTTPVTASFTAGSLAVYGISEHAGTTATPNAGWTTSFDYDTNGFHSGYRVDSPGGSYTAGATIGSSGTWGIIAMSFSDSGGGSSPVLYGSRIFVMP
jgi:hypothetical protein